MKWKATPERRNVFLDIETVSMDSNDPEGALSALAGRIVCLCLLIDDGHKTEEISFVNDDEREILLQFWSVIQRNDVFIGHNALGFDLPFIRQRSWVLNVRPSRRIDLRRFYTSDVIDTMQLWSNWGSTRYPGLDPLAQALGCGEKSGHGEQVTDWWARGELATIACYCRDDVRLSFKIFYRMMFQRIPGRFTELLQPPAFPHETLES